MKNYLSIFISLLLVLNGLVNVYAFDNNTNDINQQDSNINEAQNNEQINQEDSIDNTNIAREQTTNNIDKENMRASQSNEEAMVPFVTYQTHVQDYGWQSYVKDGETSGTTGKGKRLEAIKIRLNSGSYDGTIEYATHIQDYGWTDFVSSEQLSGTEGKSKRLEAIKIKLTGAISNTYDVYYRVHIQDYGWLDWASNGLSAGSETYGKRLEGIQIKLIKKGDSVPSHTEKPFLYPGHVYYSTHVQDYGWLNNVGDGQIGGTIGKSKRVEALKIGLCDLPYNGDIEYSAHVQNIGWQGYKKNGNIIGTIGKSKRIEALKIRLSGELSQHYDVYYRVHVQNIGWLSWTDNDNKAGTEGLSLRVEAIQIKLVEKDGLAPGDTSRPFIGEGKIEYSAHVQNIGWQNYVSNGSVAGTVGRGLRLEALKIKLGDNSFKGNIEYNAHVQDYGWRGYVSNDAVSGSVAQGKRVEAIRIRLTGEISQYYDVFYRVQCQDFGWLGWTANNGIAGTTGGNYRIESIQIKLYPKGTSNPGISNRSAIIFENSNGFKVCKDANGSLYEDAQNLLGMRSSFVLRVNKSTNVVTVLASNATGNYNIAYKRFVCSTGNDTPYGTYYTPVKYRWRYLVGPSYGQYCTRIVGGILFHSLPYNKQNPYTLQTNEFNKLGTTCSHGCIRLMCSDAKWIYDHCNLGTRVDIISGSDPLSKPQAPKIPGNQTWDPTDPNI